MLDDAELLRRHINDRCEASFAEFVQRHIDVVGNAARRRPNGNPHCAEEVGPSLFFPGARKSRAVRWLPAARSL